MTNPTLAGALCHEIGRADSDIRAELIVALALERGLVYDDLQIWYDSQFYRDYSKDVFDAELREDAQKGRQLHLHLSRSGIYDQLPEGLFFRPSPKVQNATAAEMAEAHRLNRQKEQDVRQFFQPFENEFFRQAVQLKMEELRLEAGLKSDTISDFFIDFWGLSPCIPRKFAVQLIRFLPYAAHIAGNLVLTAACLEILLQENVQINKISAAETASESFFAQELGKQQLGVDIVCGQKFFEDYPLLRFSIGPVHRDQVVDYLEGGGRFALMPAFYRFFLPVGAEVETIIEVAADEQNMLLQDGSEPVLGYSSCL